MFLWNKGIFLYFTADHFCVVPNVNLRALATHPGYLAKLTSHWAELTSGSQAAVLPSFPLTAGLAILPAIWSLLLGIWGTRRPHHTPCSHCSTQINLRAICQKGAWAGGWLWAQRELQSASDHCACFRTEFLWKTFWRALVKSQKNNLGKTET